MIEARSPPNSDIASASLDASTFTEAVEEEGWSGGWPTRYVFTTLYANIRGN